MGQKMGARSRPQMTFISGRCLWACERPYCLGASKSGLHASTDGQIKTERYTENGSPFFLSLDGGIAFHYPIGRVSLNLNPAFHYVLTDTYKVRTVTTDMLSGQAGCSVTATAPAMIVPSQIRI